MKITQRLEDGARAVARAARSVRSDLADDGPAAVYTRVLDGEHLWVAVEADAGHPALWDPAAGELLEAVDDLPVDHAEVEPDYRSARWVLDESLPPTDGAEALLVVVPEAGGKPRPLRPAPDPGSSNQRVPASLDGRWRFTMRVDDRGFVRVRRNRTLPAARLLDVRAEAGAVRLSCTAPEEGPADLLFLTKDGTVAHTLPTERVGGEVRRVLSMADLPDTLGGYRLAVGTPDQHVGVVRRRNDVLVEDPASIPLPVVIDPDTDEVAGRLQFSTHGVLRLVRKDSTTPEESA